MDKLLDAGISNPKLLEDLYLRFEADPNSVHPSLQQVFEGLPNGMAVMQVPQAPAGVADSSLRIIELIQAYRTYGHMMAQVNPIATQPPPEPDRLKLETLGFKKNELSERFPTCGVMPQSEATLQEIIDHLKKVYCSRIGVEYMGVRGSTMEQWIQQRLEPTGGNPGLGIDQKKMILTQLNKSELMESFLHTKFTGQKRFSLEGAETLIPILESIVEHGSDLDVEEVVIGMAHRGRLNVLANILEKSYGELFQEFEASFISDSFEGSGDVKYHKGFTVQRTLSNGKEVTVSIPDNPSHLEAVNGVVEGIVRARQVLVEDTSKRRVLPVLIHGDAAVAGQGVVYEVMQMYGLPGYGNGGTVHVVINNQIGFTTLPKDARSTPYCTDIARAFGAPVFHVNAEDPEACIVAARLAAEIRQKFACDVFIDLQGYRKYGHNEGDEPAFTQPLEYQLIRKKRPIRELYRDTLIQQGVLEKQLAEQLESEFKASLQEALELDKGPGKTAAQHKEQREAKHEATRASLFTPVTTAKKEAVIKEVANAFCSIPVDFKLHRKLGRLLQQRMAMIDGDAADAKIDWGMGEHLAFATLLEEGRHIRLSGQDSRRGTFSHRHAMWMDQESAQKYFPLSHMFEKQGRFDVFNSHLSEYGVMGFEFGYSITYPQALVCWEAQFGDFCNTAQVIIDQFVATSEQKWGRTSRLVLMLPHGMEGQGPEHSSGRMERFLQLAGDNNMFVVNPTTPAQLFHVLRRQVHAPYQKPLILFTPKALLRHPRCLSSLDDLSTGGFQELIDDPSPPKKAKTVVFCNGKVYYDLLQRREDEKRSDIALVRLEQLYPFHSERVEEILEKYKGFEKCYWVQEEHKNMGAWHHVRPFFRNMMTDGPTIEYIGRPRSASPATGSPALHQHQLEVLLDRVFEK